MNRATKIKQAIKRIREIKNSTTYKNGSLFNNESEKNSFNEVDTYNKFSRKKLIFKKFVLKYNNGINFIKPKELNGEKLILEDISKLINEFLGNDYLIISYFDDNVKSGKNEDIELFIKKFLLHKFGCVKTKEIESCKKLITIRENKKININKTFIDVDLVYKSSLTYTGNFIQSENVLFYGYDVEENPYLVELFKNSSPNKILNIISLRNNISFLLDNVD